ncbi:MAG: D-glycero-beta-D-manno-heptose 1-phosphate adenylyltransferase [Acidobacteriia bacterium]|nr:D-glycero-beta-D-manno-heptose 1-phosphate adenylyltransferase [Terriglobia bacterium]
MLTRLIRRVEALGRSRVLLVGDLMLDRYVYGNAERLSPEAPVPILHFEREELRPGGAGGVAADLAALGAEVKVVSLVGADDDGRRLRGLLEDLGADTGSVLEAPGRPTVCKTRLVGLARHRHAQQMIRLDFEDATSVDPALARALLDHVERALPGVAAVCIEDYDKGLLTPDVCRRVIEAARSRGVPVLVDPAAAGDYGKYGGATALKLNRAEAEKASGIPIASPDGARPAADRLLERLGLEAVIVTLDRDGAYLATRSGERRWLETRPRRVYDVTGAGDMVLAMITVARTAGASWEEAVALGNVAGGLEVERFGSVPVTPDEILRELLSEAGGRSGKQRTREQLVAELLRHRATGKRIVFTNGCFDLIHLGHVKYFQFAKQQGDVLAVAVNSDVGTRRLKGPSRPIIEERDRLALLEELESIDYLTLFDEDTPIELIAAIRPDVLVKGADYRKDQVVGSDLVESYGGRVALCPLVEGRSTSAVIRRILDLNEERGRG